MKDIFKLIAWFFAFLGLFVLVIFVMLRINACIQADDSLSWSQIRRVQETYHEDLSDCDVLVPTDGTLLRADAADNVRIDIERGV
jgi:hypothetical protein